MKCSVLDLELDALPDFRGVAAASLKSAHRRLRLVADDRWSSAAGLVRTRSSGQEGELRAAAVVLRGPARNEGRARLPATFS